MIPDRVFYPLAVLIVAAVIGLALVWPQGQGAPSPAPFREPLANTAAQAPVQAPVQVPGK
jgi:hypothetical protein